MKRFRQLVGVEGVEEKLSDGRRHGYDHVHKREKRHCLIIAATLVVCVKRKSEKIERQREEGH